MVSGIMERGLRFSVHLVYVNAYRSSDHAYRSSDHA